MARVAVVGGGFGGMATAARLAKLGHTVTLIEEHTELGGALRPVTAEGHSWDASATYTLLPAVLRDLFRKSGRPLEKELELVRLPVVREHRFEDDSRIEIPGGSRAEQLAAFDDLGPGVGRQWGDYVRSFAEEWELIRREYLERPWAPELAPKELAGRLLPRQSLHRRIRSTLRDERLRLVAGFPFELGGHELRKVPGWLGSVSYVEHEFGAWTVPGGMSSLVEALQRRLDTRGVQVLAGAGVEDLVLRDARVVAVRTKEAELDADAVVVAIDPRRLPTLAPLVARTVPASPPTTTYLGLSGELPTLAPETVLHGDPMLVVRTGGMAAEDGQAWTVHARGAVSEDLVTTLVRHGIDVRDAIRVRVDRSAREHEEQWSGSPEGVRWQGRGTIRARLGPRTPLAGVYAAGAHATPGAGLPFVGLSAALVAQAIGPA